MNMPRIWPEFSMPRNSMAGVLATAFRGVGSTHTPRAIDRLDRGTAPERLLEALPSLEFATHQQ